VNYQDEPVQSLTWGYSLAAQQSKNIFVGEGTYALSQTLQLVDGVSIYGGFSGIVKQFRLNFD